MTSINPIPEIKLIDAALLTGPVRQTLNRPTAEISDWEHYPITYINTEESNLGLHRFSGTAQDQGTAHSWSIVLKAVHAPVNETNAIHWNYHRREILAYQSGLLANLPGDLLAPRCLGVMEHPDGVCWLWLEDLWDSENRPWSLTEYSLAAHILGRFNGTYAAGETLPVLPWLSQHWLRGWLKEYDEICRIVLELIRDQGFWQNPLLQAAFPQTVTEDVLQLWTHHAALLATLDQLPRTFCHLDAYRPNLFIRRDAQDTEQVMAIDWVFTGIAAIGEEIANLLAASLIWFEYDADEAKRLDKAIFTSYLDGLSEAGWKGDSRFVRLGYTAACALRWGVVGLWWMRWLGDTSKLADLEKQWNRPISDLISQWAKSTYYVLDLAKEAYQLQQVLF